jgi:hypothetical protein
LPPSILIFHRKPKLDPDLNVGESERLDSSVAKHKLAVKPHKKHASSHRSSTSPHKTYEPKPGERYGFIFDKSIFN